MMFSIYFWTAALLCGLTMSDSLSEKTFVPLKLDKRGNSNFGANLAEGKPTGQSSTSWGGSSGRAVDGIWNPNWSKQSCTHTDSDNNPFWWVDLRRRYRISGVAIQNRAGWFSGRLSNIKVWVGNSLDNKMTVCATHSAAVGSGEVIILHCRSNARGRYIKIQLMKKGYLTLCEVAVFGK